jgi:hypothetical protein
MPRSQCRYRVLKIGGGDGQSGIGSLLTMPRSLPASCGAACLGFMGSTPAKEAIQLPISLPEELRLGDETKRISGEPAEDSGVWVLLPFA